MTIAPGSRLGIYEVIAPIGRGGMGAVYRARDTRLHRDVALKVLPDERRLDPEARARFEREAFALAALNHPNIATVYGIENAGDIQALVMELVDGETLADRLDMELIGTPRPGGTAARTGGELSRHDMVLPLVETLTIARQLAAALDAAHERGIVHRDLKPSNIKIRPDGTVKVLDFGLAKSIGTEQREREVIAATLTAAPDRSALGTPPYMSPEQVRGQELDRRVDIWAFGCVLYEMLTGRRAFAAATSAETFASVLEREPDYDALPAATPLSVRRLLQRCLEKDPRQRLRDIGDARIELDHVPEAPTAPARFRPRPPDRDRAARLPPHLTAIVVAGMAFASVVVLGMYAWRSSDTRTAPRETVRLTFDDGLQTQPSFAPDGQSIAYASDKSGNFDVWAQPVSGGNPIRVTNDRAHDWQPHWSPAGNQIVFRSERGSGGLFIVPATGGFEQKIADFGYRPLWSPQGSRVLFTQTVAAGIAAPLFTVGLDGRPPKAVFHDVTPSLRAFGWYGDDRTILLLRSDAPAFSLDLRTVDADSGAQKRWSIDDGVARRAGQLEVAVTPGDVVAANPTGNVIVFTAQSRGVSGVWRLVLDRRAARVVDGPHPVSEMTDADGVSLSADGRRLAFAVAPAPPRLWSYPILERGLAIDRAQPITAAAVSASSPDVTMDGETLLYMLTRPASRQRRELVIHSLADGQERTVRVIDADRESLALARWARDGAHISYAHLSVNGQLSNARLLDVASGHESELTSPTPTDARQLAWAPHQVSNWSPRDELVVSSGTQYVPGKAAVVLLPVAAAPRAERSARILTSSGSPLNQPVISPNGRWIAFRAASRSPAGASIMVMGIAGGPASAWRRVSAAGQVWDDKPRWSVDGRRIYFTSTRGGPLNIWAADFDEDAGVVLGPPVSITSFGGPGEQILRDMREMEIAVSRDRLIMPIVHPRGGIWMIDHLDPALR